MQEESGFFTSPGLNDNAAFSSAGHDSYHDFKNLYTSRLGFCQLLLARRHGRLFAVKTLRAEYRGNDVAEIALRKEYDAGIMVDSPYVVRTFDFIPIPDFGNCIILEYCPGEALRDIIDSGIALSTSETDEIVNRIAKALADIHAAGLIHRDIKPDNIIYSRQTGSLKVIDMGCADSSGFCVLHEPAGTERYTPPGRTVAGSPVDTHNDLYSIGMVLSELRQIASPCRRKPLAQLSSSLIKGEIANVNQAYTYYCRLLSRHRLSRRLKLIVPAFISILVGIIFISVYISDNHHPDDGYVGSKATETDTTISTYAAHPSTEAFNNLLAKEQSMPLVDSREKGSVQSSDSSERKKDDSQADGQFIVPGIVIPPEELEKNRYGVAMVEAKYLAVFKRNEFDYYVMQQTDNVMTEAVVIVQSNAPADKRRAYYELYSSEEKTAEAVLAKVRVKFSDADLRRARGLVSQRWHWLRSSSPPLAAPDKD